MRNYNKYKVLFVDIDNTLIYGPWTQLMHHTWNIFHSPKLSHVLMIIQNRLNLYSVNKKLLWIIQQFIGDVVFITARKQCNDTSRMLEKICGFTPLIYALGTDNVGEDKLEIAKEYIYRHSLTRKQAVIIDDSRDVRENFFAFNIDAIDPTPMYERLVG